MDAYWYATVEGRSHIRVCSSSGWGETSIWHDCPQLKLRVPELPTHPEKRVLPTLQGEVADKGPTATITAQVRSSSATACRRRPAGESLS